MYDCMFSGHRALFKTRHQNKGISNSMENPAHVRNTDDGKEMCDINNDGPVT